MVVVDDRVGICVVMFGGWGGVGWVGGWVSLVL